MEKVWSKDLQLQIVKWKRNTMVSYDTTSIYLKFVNFHPTTQIEEWFYGMLKDMAVEREPSCQGGKTSCQSDFQPTRNIRYFDFRNVYPLLNVGFL